MKEEVQEEVGSSRDEIHRALRVLRKVYSDGRVSHDRDDRRVDYAESAMKAIEIVFFSTNKIYRGREADLLTRAFASWVWMQACKGESTDACTDLPWVPRIDGIHERAKALAKDLR